MQLFCRGSLSKHERRKYIEAVQCLISKPSQSDPSFAPGARTRFDDFVAVHINQTMYIHLTVSFLSSVHVSLLAQLNRVTS